MSENKPMSDNKEKTNNFLSGLKEESSTTSNAFSIPAPKTQAPTHSVIGNGISFRGELIGTEDLLIEGKVEGTVIMAGQNLTIGEEGELNANIHVQNISVHGKLTGDVLADELIEIKQTAVVKGNLIAPRIQLEDGGKFRGSMDMIDSEEDKQARTSEFEAKLVHPHLPSDDVKSKTKAKVEKKSDSEEKDQSSKKDK